LVILVMFFLITRLSILFTSFDKVHFDEELYRGNIARELIVAPILPFFDYQRSEYEGGSLVMGALAVPFFLLFGQTAVSLKLVALFFSLAMFIAWYMFLDKFFNRWVAVLTSLLWIFSPCIYTTWSIFASGAHHEQGIFSILAVYIFYQIFFVGEKRWLFALLGAISGFGLFFSYTFSTTLAVILLFWFIFDKKFVFTKNFFLFAVFFLASLSPWVYFNVTHNFEGFIVADKPVFSWFTHNTLSVSLLRLRDLVTTEFISSLSFQNVGSAWSRVIAGAHYLAFAASFLGLLFIGRRSLLKIAGGVISRRRFAVAPKELARDTLLIVFPIVYFIVLSMTGFELRSKFSDPRLSNLYQYRLFMPVFPFIFALAAIFCHKMFKNRKNFFVSYSGLCLAAGMVILGAVTNSNMIPAGNSGDISLTYAMYRGYNYYDLGKIICRRFSDPRVAVRLIKGIKADDDRRYCYAGMGWGFNKERFGADYGFYIRNVLPGLNRQYWPDACERLGSVVGCNNDLVQKLRDSLGSGYLPYFYRGAGAKEAKMSVHVFAAYSRIQEQVDAEYRPYFHEGMGMQLYELLINDTANFISFTGSVDRQLKESLYRGMAEGQEYYQYSYSKFGFGIGGIGYRIDAWNQIIDKVEDEFRPYCYQRLGIEIGWRFVHDIKKYLTFFQKADEKYAPYIYKGLGIGIGWRFGYDADGCSRLIDKIDKKYWPYIYEGLEMGSLKREGLQPDHRVNRSERTSGGAICG